MKENIYKENHYLNIVFVFIHLQIWIKYYLPSLNVTLMEKKRIFCHPTINILNGCASGVLWFPMLTMLFL